jgi:hypothetical protein
MSDDPKDWFTPTTFDDGADGPSSATMDYVPLVLPPPGSDEQMFGAE